MPKVIKFFTGKTSRAMEILAQESLKLPRIAFCLNYPYKADMLSKMNLPAEFFHSRDPKYRNSVPFPNLHETWQRATYSKDELLLRWYFYSGVNGSASVEEVNTLYDGKCFVWSLKDDVSPTSRVIKQLYVGLPENKTGFAFFFHPEASTAGVALDNWASLVIPSNLEENMYYAKEIFVEYHSSLPSEAAPCYDAPEQSYFKCMEKLATQVYFDFPKPKWPEVRGPCWVPQATNVVNASLLSKLGQCDMWESYHCMLTSLKEARLATGSKCKASCFETKYVITTKGKAKQIRKMTVGLCSASIKSVGPMNVSGWQADEDLVGALLRHHHRPPRGGVPTVRLRHHRRPGGRLTGTLPRLLLSPVH